MNTEVILQNTIENVTQKLCAKILSKNFPNICEVNGSPDDEESSSQLYFTLQLPESCNDLIYSFNIYEAGNESGSYLLELTAYFPTDEHEFEDGCKIKPIPDGYVKVVQEPLLANTIGEARDLAISYLHENVNMIAGELSGVY